MRLYKFDYKGAIGNNVMTVPTDSQFLIGIGNGDATATARLFDGNTEILPEEYKIGEYTCFRFETNGTPFRKPYKAVISGTKFVEKRTWGIFIESLKDYPVIMAALPPEIEITGLIYDGTNTPTPPSFPVYLYGSQDYEKYTYIETRTLTYAASTHAYQLSGTPIEFESGGNLGYLQFTLPTPGYFFDVKMLYDTGREFNNGQYTADDKSDVSLPIPYTHDIDLVVLCQKMSVAYRDLEGSEGSITPEQIINTVSASQRFLEKQNGVWDASSSPVLVDSATFQGNVVFTPANPNTQALTVQGRIIAIARSDGVAIDVSNGNVNLNQGKITFTNSGRTYELSPTRLTIDGQDYFVLATNPINS